MSETAAQQPVTKISAKDVKTLDRGLRKSFEKGGAALKNKSWENRTAAGGESLASERSAAREAKRSAHQSKKRAEYILKEKARMAEIKKYTDAGVKAPKHLSQPEPTMKERWQHFAKNALGSVGDNIRSFAKAGPKPSRPMSTLPPLGQSGYPDIPTGPKVTDAEDESVTSLKVTTPSGAALGMKVPTQSMPEIDKPIKAFLAAEPQTAWASAPDLSGIRLVPGNGEDVMNQIRLLNELQKMTNQPPPLL